MSNKPQILNIINFVRGVEPRNMLDLYKPVEKQLELIMKHNLPATFLLQYDALLQDKYTNLLKPAVGKGIEIGIWLEIVEPLVEKAGIKWRGRQGYSWDWHSNVGFSVGYTVNERKKLVDIVMEDFNDTFGFFPESVGSWMIDIQTLTYLKEKYDIKASCNCKDQWGTDGYTLWGGYYNGAYYPSKNNAFTPAQTEAMQVGIPIFRMLGSDPVDQYDAGLENQNELNPAELQPVITLEPVYKFGGGEPKWVDWFFEVIFNDNCLSYGYTQVGQENSFGWEAMKNGFSYQIEKISNEIKNGRIRAMTLADLGKWHSENYKLTPASAIAVNNDLTGSKSSVWYYNRFYRSNYYVLENIPRIRDLFLFNESYKERYLTDVCKTKDMVYDNLPVIDGNRWSLGEIRAGLYFLKFNKDGYDIIKSEGEPFIREQDAQELEITSSTTEGKLTVRYGEKTVDITVTGTEKWGMLLKFCSKQLNTKITVSEDSIQYEHNNSKYAVKISGGKLYKSDNGIIIKCERLSVRLNFEN